MLECVRQLWRVCDMSVILPYQCTAASNALPRPFGSRRCPGINVVYIAGGLVDWRGAGTVAHAQGSVRSDNDRLCNVVCVVVASEDALESIHPRATCHKEPQKSRTWSSWSKPGAVNQQGIYIKMCAKYTSFTFLGRDHSTIALFGYLFRRALGLCCAP